MLMNIIAQQEAVMQEAFQTPASHKTGTVHDILATPVPPEELCSTVPVTMRPPSKEACVESKRRAHEREMEITDEEEVKIILSKSSAELHQEKIKPSN